MLSNRQRLANELGAWRAWPGVRWLLHQLWLRGFPRWKHGKPCYTCKRLSYSEHEHLTHRCRR